MTATPLGPGAEFDWIRAIAIRLGSAAGELGDDCAPVPEGSGQLVISTDATIEGVHFRQAWLTPEEIGWRATARAVSDLAAMGARPVGITVALALPVEAADLAPAIMAGVSAMVSECGCRVLGGDLSAGPVVSMVVTVLGRAERPVWRRGGVAGDGLWVTGTLGGSRAALAGWEAGRELAAARDAFAHPAPRLAAGQWLARNGAHAMIDLSDGLAGDLPHLAAASGLGAEVDLAAVPVHPAVMEVVTDEAPAAFAARGGEDYELLVAMPSAFNDADAARFAGDCGLPLTRIGTLRSPGPVVFRHGEQVVELSGFSHFAGPR